MKHHPTKNLIQGLAFSLLASLGSASPAIAEDGIEVCGPLDGSFGDIHGRNIIEVAAGPHHAVVLTDIAINPVRAAGWNGPFDPDTGAPCGQCDPPDFPQSVRAVAAGARHSMALLDNGTIVCWGCDDPACDVPPELAAGDPPDPAVGIAAGDGFSLALLASGEIVMWGESDLSDIFEIPVEAQDPSNPAVRILAQSANGSWPSVVSSHLLNFITFRSFLSSVRSSTPAEPRCSLIHSRTPTLYASVPASPTGN